MIRPKALQLLLLVSSMTSQVIGMIPQEITERPTEETSGMKLRMEKMGESLGRLLPPELKHQILSSALELKLNPKYGVYKKLNVGSRVTGIALNADNTRALTVSDDKIARIWDVENGKLLKELRGHTMSIESVALSADGSIALTGSGDGAARVWDANTGELLKTFQVNSPVLVLPVALSADGSTALIGGLGGIARLYNTSTGELLKELKGHKDLIKSVALSADGSTALTGASKSERALVWDTLTGDLIRTLEGDYSYVLSVALSDDGAIALIVTFDLSGVSKALVWDVKSGTLLNTLPIPARSVVALSKDGEMALVSTGDKIQVWNAKPLPGQKEVNIPLAVLEGHTNRVTAVAFGGADFIASGSYDKTALIWKPRESVTLK